MKNLWQKLWQTPNNRWLPAASLGGLVMLIIGAGGLGITNFIVHKTSENEFCFSCHSHEVNVRAEYEASSHFTNRTGVRAMCSDCHLPKNNWLELMTTKVIVSADIIPELSGKLDTPEKWEEHRSEMAEQVWQDFRENDSKFCRNCHVTEAMQTDLQSSMAVTMHAAASQSGRTCIDCHRGLVHALPKSG